ncbi:MAG TPA: MraY family glycosyltransferase [Bacteroidia bacterium]|nr:undecaprenyl/decaprenyl-phosphate alpha-N-acetylglucosaminyl 1-phosphate transferase [Bacteroidia bacterium]MBP7713951.1 undecaprenyl/decaprenyl-phosphate alpha-N-acetylglucosaminyl 1-phosphate transferase [Bacteroidia bacterium]MBP8669286.1 undecaprenyl/decaprenyl-phosphate alpha-N-acetylglucosaminyl 1-phosphate transferase [Bacteroidia bacterium]HOZ82993.1 MraY family glycosyltransferase [Bacteroidia bacterium]HOZ90752.1 MraY family glycosyltransferase [Bacteroidia bacterium]
MNQIIQLLFPFISSLIIASLIIPSWIQLCSKWNLFDRPDTRKHHTAIIPSLGGIGIFIAIMISIFLFGYNNQDSSFHSIAAAMLILFITGFFDDLTDLKARVKLNIQLLAALIVTYSGLRIQTLNGFTGIHELPIIAQYGISIFIIIFLVNAYNFIDGLDGLAATIGLIIFSIFTVLFHIHGQQAYAVLCVSVIGALVSFLYFNFNPARVFMGDTGSLVVGFLIAICTLKLFNLWFTSPVVSFGPSLTIATIFILIFDLTRVVFIRVTNGISPFKADRSHLHHMICRQQFGHRGGTFIMAAFNILFIVLVLPLSKLRFITFLVFCFCVAILLMNSKVMSYVALLRNKITGAPESKMGVDRG